MDEKQYLKMRAKAEEEFKKNLEAIDRVWHMAHPDRPLPKSAEGLAQVVLTNPPFARASNASGQFSLSQAVERIVASMGDIDNISQPIVLAKLLTETPALKDKVRSSQIKPQIAARLSRLEKRGELTRVKESFGSEPAVFRKIGLIPTNDSDDVDALPLT